MSEYYSYHDIPWFGWRRPRPTSSPISNETVPVGLSTRPPSADGSRSGDTRKRTKESEAHQEKRMIRMHRFLTGRGAGGVKPVFGLTAYVFALQYTIPHQLHANTISLWLLIFTLTCTWTARFSSVLPQLAIIGDQNLMWKQRGNRVWKFELGGYWNSYEPRSEDYARMSVGNRTGRKNRGCQS